MPNKLDELEKELESLTRAEKASLCSALLAIRCYPTLRAEDLTHAWSFVRAHRAEIEEQIRENEEA